VVTTVLVIALIAVSVALIAALAALAVFRTQARRGIAPPGKSPRRVLFPFVGRTLSQSALDAALRLARAEGAVLMPAYLIQVPFNLGLESSLPAECEGALPMMEAIEQRAQRAGVPVDARIERGRTYRHALSLLLEHERYDRIIVAATSRNGDGFSADDVAWLLEHAPGEIVVVRPGNGSRIEPLPAAVEVDPGESAAGSPPAAGAHAA
jgi:hypothetical protein